VWCSGKWSPIPHLTPLSPLQLRILALLDLSPRLYTTLCGGSY
jgi:hypothetical protein